jgi:hypothetical protein
MPFQALQLVVSENADDFHSDIRSGCRRLYRMGEPLDREPPTPADNASLAQPLLNGRRSGH